MPNDMSNTLYALIIGINDYPIREHRLQGCVPDAEAIHDFLAGVCAQEQMKFDPVVLLNDHAKLHSVVDGFEHFGQAKDGDICVLYYSGHGSLMDSPREFWKIDTNRQLETMVCWDSRIDNGRDLTDKELSYLIWKHTKGAGKDIHFLSIFDCCHSGTITRGVAEKPAGGLTSRMANKNLNVFSFFDMAGNDAYIRDADGAIRPPLGDYVTLSAAQSDESAYEMNIGGAPRGIFTNALLDVLYQSNLQHLSYADLVSRVYTRVQNQTNVQTPQHPLVHAYGSHNSRSLFLNGRMSKAPQTYVKNDDKLGWVIDLGAIHGVRPGARLTVDAGGAPMDLRARIVRAGDSIVEPDGWLNPAQSEYLVTEIDLKRNSLVVGLAPGLTDDVKNALTAAIGASEKLYLDQDAAQYLAGFDSERGYVLTRPGQEMPVFRGVRPEEAAGDPVAVFVGNIETVAAWEHVSELSSPGSPDNMDNWLDIELAEVLEHHDFSKALRKKEKDPGEEAVFSYQYQNGEWVEPALQLRVKTKASRSLWVAGLYLSEDFSITDAFMQVRELKPDDEPYAFTDDHGNDIISLWLPDEIYSWGETEITNRIKLIASTERFTVSQFCQDGLQLEPKEIDRGATTRGARRDQNKATWVIKDINLRIVRPLDAQPLSAGRNLKAHRLTIEGHPGLSAQGVRLSSSQETARSVGAGRPRFVLDNFTDVVNLAASRDVSRPLDVIELNDVTGTETVNAEQPLKLQLGQKTADNTTIVPFGLDAETGLYFPIGYMDESGTVRIEQIPDGEDEGRKRGFGKSFKIYLKGLWFNKVLETGRDISTLAIAEVADEHSDVTYIKDQNTVRDRVANANRILVVMHGWMGDTSDKAKIARRAKRTVDGQTQDLTDLYDLVLTYDYDSLGQPAETSAQQLKAQLEAAGLSADDGKTVHLLAHSTGGLIARWMLEQEGGAGLVDHLVMTGCPNGGTPWAKAYDLAVLGLGKLINFLPIPGNINEVLGFLGKIRGGMDEAIQQFSGESELMKTLKDGKAPIPYTVIAGDTKLFPERDEREEQLLRRYLDRFKGAYRSSLEAVLFGEANDDMVSLRSMQELQAEGKARVALPAPVPSSHLTYFTSEAGVKAISDVLFEL